MKTCVISLMVLLCAFVFRLNAQDIIYMRNADEIKASVMEIADTDVTYYEWNDLSKTVRILKKDEIFMIRYQWYQGCFPECNSNHQ